MNRMSKSHPQRITAKDRETTALDLRRQGLSYRQIAETMNCHEDTIYKAIKRALARLNEEIAEKAIDVRRIELERMDYYLIKLLPGIEEGDTKAITAALKVSERRAKLLGLDAPKQLDINAVEISAEQVKQLLEQRGINTE